MLGIYESLGIPHDHSVKTYSILSEYGEYMECTHGIPSDSSVAVCYSICYTQLWGNLSWNITVKKKFMTTLRLLWLLYRNQLKTNFLPICVNVFCFVFIL